MVPACSSGTLTNVLAHRNVMPQTQDMTPHPVTVYRHGANLSLCCTLMWNVTLEYTATHFNVLGEKLSRKYRTNRVLNPGPVVCESSTLSARPQRLRYYLVYRPICNIANMYKYWLIYYSHFINVYQRQDKKLKAGHLP